MNQLYRNIKRMACLVLIAALSAALFGCVKAPAVVRLPADTQAVLPKDTLARLHRLDADNLEEVASSGLISLLFDPDTCAFAVKTKGGALWSALPREEGDDMSARVIGVNVIHNDKLYALNSQDNAVAFGSVSYETSDTGIQVSYLLSDAATHVSDAIKEKVKDAKPARDGSLRIRVTASYEMKDGCLYASLNWENLGKSTDIVTDIGFLEYFGAQKKAKKGDFLLVPDGCGAVIDTADEEEVEPIDIAVYGNDYNSHAALTSVVAAFGQKQGSEALAAVIQEGEAVSMIRAAKASETEPFNRIGTSFTITPYEEAETELLYAPQAAYTGKITVCYRFVSDKNATPIGIAGVCRELLIRDYTLSTRTVEEQEDMPVLIQVIGWVDRDYFIPVPKKLTDFSGAKDLLTRVKSKGVNNAFLRCTGFMSGGTDAQNAAQARPSAFLGGMKGLKELNEYANGQNFCVFTDINVSTSRTKSGAIRTLSGSRAAMGTYNSLIEQEFAVKNRTDYVMTSDQYKKAVSKTLSRFRSLGATGYCVTDLGNALYGDYAAANRPAVSDSTPELLAPLSVNSRVMVVGGNFYSLKNADVVSGLPMLCGRDETMSYTAIPFVQSILHGIVDYCFDDINLQIDSKMSLLHCIEYGAVPGYCITDKSLGSEKYDDLYGADNRLNEIGNAYTMVSELFADLRSAHITDHYEIQNGVYCTEYESTTKIYVNYTAETVSIGNVNVEPMGYFRVN